MAGVALMGVGGSVTRRCNEFRALRLLVFHRKNLVSTDLRRWAGRHTSTHTREPHGEWSAEYLHGHLDGRVASARGSCLGPSQYRAQLAWLLGALVHEVLIENQLNSLLPHDIFTRMLLVSGIVSGLAGET